MLNICSEASLQQMCDITVIIFENAPQSCSILEQIFIDVAEKLVFRQRYFIRVNTLSPGRNGNHFVEDILKCIFRDKNSLFH